MHVFFFLHFFDSRKPYKYIDTWYWYTRYFFKKKKKTSAENFVSIAHLCKVRMILPSVTYIYQVLDPGHSGMPEKLPEQPFLKQACLNYSVVSSYLTFQVSFAGHASGTRRHA